MYITVKMQIIETCLGASTLVLWIVFIKGNQTNPKCQRFQIFYSFSTQCNLAYKQEQNGDDVLGVDGLNRPLLLVSLKSENLVCKSQDDPQLVPLALFRLSHLRNLELLSR